MNTKDLNSIGYLATRLQVPVGAVRAAANALCISPALSINGVPHYSERQAERIGLHVNENRSLIETRSRRKR